ncbi:MAG: dihydropteroate synthase [Chloroflexi bacterium]|nr:dihydropteroate synthase [Chloroflexota bacterium]
MKTVISSAAKEVVMGDGNPTILIGELFREGWPEKMPEMPGEQLLESLLEMANAQVQAGADAIDVTIRGRADEVEMLPKVVQELMGALDVPLCLTSSKAQALDAALKIYRGKALLSGVISSEKSLSTFLPLAKKYGAALIIQVREGAAAPEDAGQRLAVARRVIERATAEGVPVEDVVIDCLPFSPSVEKGGGTISLETVRRVTAELGVNTTISDLHTAFGLPGPNIINGAFANAAICAGAACLPIEVTGVRTAVLAADVIAGRDLRCKRYLTGYRQIAASGKS